MARTTVQIGQSVNLLAGLRPGWDPRRGQLDLLCPSRQPAMETAPPEAVTGRGQWGLPEITLHDSALGLLDALMPCQVVNPASFVDPPVLGAGALLAGFAGAQAALDTLSRTIGVDLGDPGLGYALVTLRRRDGIASHASAEGGVLVHVRPTAPDAAYRLNTGFVKAAVRLRHAGHAMRQDFGPALNPTSANAILDSFAEYGTHYVCGVELGDAITQVFAYPAHRFAAVRQAYADGSNPLGGPGAETFAQFTTLMAEGPFGFVSQVGHLLSASHSTAFQDSLQRGDWQDTLWSHRDSVFALFNTQAPLPWHRLDELFQDQATTGIQLAPLGIMVEHKRSLLWQQVFKGALAQKFGARIQPNFTVHDERDFVGLLPEDQPGILSTIATPSINLYKTRVDVGSLHLVAPEQVQDFTVLAQVLSAAVAGTAGAVQLPGRRVRLVAQVVDMRTSAQPREIVLGDEAFETLQIACDEFLGALVLRNASGSRRHVIVDGLMFGLRGSGRDAAPVVLKDVRTPPPAEWLPQLADSLEYSMAFAEAVVSDQVSTADAARQAFVRRSLNWLASCIPATVSQESLLALRVRALDLARYAADPGYGSFVPILPSSEFDALIDSLLGHLDRIQLQIAQTEQRLAQRRLEERVIEVGQALNRNIVASGQLLRDVIEANAAQQQDLAGYYEGLVAQQQAEAIKQQAAIDSLEGTLMQARSEVDAAQQAYKAAVEQWQTMEAIKLGLDIATNLFGSVTAVAIPASAMKAVQDLGALAQKIQKGLNVLNATFKLYNGTATGIKGLKGAQQTLDGLDEAGFGDVSSVNWDQMNILFTQILATGPDVKEAKARLQAAFSTLVLRGKALASAKSSLHTIQRDIYSHQQQKIINRRQAARFSALTGPLRAADIAALDTQAIDLVGLTGYLCFIQHQMLGMLAKAFLHKDLALQYANLQPATPVASFSLMKFSAAVVQQNATALRARAALLEHQAGTTTPIVYEVHGIDPARLIDGQAVTVTIYPDAAQFQPFVHARVVAVVAQVDGVASTDGGTCAVKLEFAGMPFHDRDIHRHTLHFHTAPRERVYLYDTREGTPCFTDAGASWSQGSSRITPFSSWNISLPATQVNQGLRFNRDRLTIRLSFVLEARVVDQQLALHRALTRRLGSPAALRLMAMGPAAAPPAAPLGLPSSSQLVAQLFAQGSVTNGWDVVFNMALGEINTALKAQYDALAKNPRYTNEIKFETSEHYPGVNVVTRLALRHGYPLMSFGASSGSTVQLSLPVLSGSLQKCSRFSHKPEVCDPPSSLADVTLTAHVDLTKVAGVVQVGGEQHDMLEVRLDLAQGAFSVANIELSDVQKVALGAAIKAHFVNHAVVFVINRLDLSGVPTLDALKPSGFLFKTLETPLKNPMLQLFIMTGGRPVREQSQAFLNNTPEPLPLDSSTSLIIRSGLVFQDLLPQSLATGGWALEGVAPVAPAKAWSARLTRASVLGTVDMGRLAHSDGITTRGGGSMSSYTYSIPGGSTVSWSLEGTSLTASESGQLRLSGSQKQTLSYNEHRRKTTYYSFFSDTDESDQMLKTEVVLNVSAALSFQTEGSDRDQTIRVATSGQAVTVSGRFSGGGPSGSTDFEAQVNAEINQQLPPQIAPKLSFQFKAISVFALRNLLFPAGHCLAFSSCAVPGDLLLLGNFRQVGA